MSQSTDAILFYGYCWDESADLFGDDVSDEWSDRVAKAGGVIDPWLEYPTNDGLPYPERKALGDAWIVDHDAELTAWREARKAIEDEFACDIGQHCSGDYP